MALTVRMKRLSDKLQALRYPYHFDEQADVEDHRMLRDVCVWAEDALVRLLPQPDRAPLRSSDAAEFRAALVSYVGTAAATCGFHELAVPSVARAAAVLGKGPDPASMLRCVDAIASCALRLQIVDDGAAAELSEAHTAWTADNGGRLVTSFADATTTAASVTVAGPATLTTVLRDVYGRLGRRCPESVSEAAADIQRQLECTATVAMARAQPLPSQRRSGTRKPRGGADNALALLDEALVSMGLHDRADGDPGALKRAVGALRLALCLDLRLLHSSMNRSVAAMQDVTATCKLDVKRGRVGR